MSITSPSGNNVLINKLRWIYSDMGFSCHSLPNLMASNVLTGSYPLPENTCCFICDVLFIDLTNI